MSTSPNEFFNTEGGNLNAEAPSYVARKADDELYDGLRRGEYCYVLTSRQTGKSSLAIRIAERLRAEGTAVAQLDLTTLGHNLNPEQWYYGLLFALGEQLGLEGELEEFWQSHDDLGPLQRWMQAVHDVVLERCPGPVVLVIDEIDYVRRLPFSTDELFAAIRACFNRRADDPPMCRLTFCLLGTVTPSELIEDPNTTPFNIGRRIELNDFTEAEAATLARGLGCGEATAARLMRRVYHWTGGQPYLTQSLCRAVAEAPQVLDATGVDRVCQSLFFTGRACATDKNLQFVGRHILGQEDRLRDGRPGDGQPPPGGTDELGPEDRRRASLLDLYAKVRRGRTVPDDETSPVIGNLRLSGLVRVVQGMLHVRNRIYRRVFDEVWIRSNMPRTVAQIRREAYLRGVRKATFIAAAVLGLAAVAAYWCWDTYYHLKTFYYANFGKRYGVYKGIGLLSPEKVHHRTASLKFSSLGGKVEKVEVVDGADHLTNPYRLPSWRAAGEYLTDERKSHIAGDDEWKSYIFGDATKECQWEFIRDSEDNVVYEKARDKAGRLVYGLLYVPTGRPTEATAFYIDHNGFPQARSGSGAAYVKIVHSEQGYDREIRYFDIQGTPRLDENGGFGERREIDLKTGLLVSVTDLGPDGKEPMLRKEGYASARFTYDPRGNITEVAYFDAQGRPTRYKNGYAKATHKHDEWGNITEEAYFDEQGRPTRHKMIGCAKGTIKYDERGNITEGAFFDEQGRPTRTKIGFAKFTLKYDERGNQTEGAFFDEQGRPTRTKDGYAKTTIKYDEHGIRTEEACFDEQGRPTRTKDGFAKVTVKYDERGNMTEGAYFDEQGRPTRSKDGCAKVTSKYDERGNMTEAAYFDEQGRPTRSKDGYAKVTSKYDERGNMTEAAYFDEQGRPTRSKDGYAKVTSKYDERGNMTEAAYFDEQSRPTRHKDGFARWTAKHDERGNQVEWACFDEQGRPTRHKDGFARLTTRYDERGNMTEAACFDEQGRPTRVNDGFARWTAKHDERDNRTEQAYFDEQGRPTRSKDGYAKVTSKFDERGNMTEAAYFDEQGRPILHKDGYTRLTKEYDAEGDPLNVTYYGLDGNPITTHLMATEIVPGGQAKAIGLEPGDIILSYDGKAGLNRRPLSVRCRLPARGPGNSASAAAARSSRSRSSRGSSGSISWTAPCKVKRRQAPDPFGSRREKGTSLSCAQQNRNLEEEEGTSEGNLVALA